MSSEAFLPYGCQELDQGDIDAVVLALRSSHLTQGPRVAEFEDALASFTDSEFIAVCSSGTAALHLVYAGLGLGPGDELITSPITFSATASAAYQVGASVRLADVDPRTGNIDVDSVAQLIGPATKAIVAVHLGGLPADMKGLRELADDHGLFLIGDAAHALGAEHHGMAIGTSFADASTFSFHPVKNLTTGEGGAVVVRDAEVLERIRRLRHHGIERAGERMRGEVPGPWYYEVQEQGWNYRLTDIQCALGLSQLGKQPVWLERRRSIAERYREAIAQRFGEHITVQPQSRHSRSAFHLLVSLIDFDAFGVTRATAMTRLREVGIGTQVHYVPLYHHPFHQERLADNQALVGAEKYYSQALSLPMYPALSDADVARVCDSLARALEE